jgi:hypothetical protein
MIAGGIPHQSLQQQSPRNAARNVIPGRFSRHRREHLLFQPLPVGIGYGLAGVDRGG